MTKAFKFFNAIQIILFIALAVCALASTVYSVANLFNLDMLAPITALIDQYCVFIKWIFGYGAGYFLAEFVPAIEEYISYIVLGVSSILFIWSFIMVIRMCRPNKHYKKFRGFTFVLHLLFTIIMALNAIDLFQNGALKGNNLQAMIAFIVNIAIIILFVYYFIMNLRGRKLLQEDDSDLDPNGFFGGPPQSGPATYGPPQGGPNQFAPGGPPVRRPPPPPPQRPPVRRPPV